LTASGAQKPGQEWKAAVIIRVAAFFKAADYQ
jgi:hypothetical protein